MSARLEFVRDKPQGFWILDNPSPFQDYSGNSRTATASGTEAKHSPLIKGATYAQVFSSSRVGTFSCPLFKTGSEAKPFTLEACIRPMNATTIEQQILGNNNQMDGLTINGTVLSFVTKYSTTGECRASYDLQEFSNIVVHGVHTDTKNSLYVNGELKAEAVVGEDQLLDSFVTTDANIYCGATTGTTKFAANGIAVYSTAMAPENIARHYQVAHAGLTSLEVATAFSGGVIPLGYDNRDVFMSRTLDSAQDWEGGIFNNTVITADQLLPQFIDGVSQASSWTTSLALDASSVISVNGLNMYWDGSGVTVEASVDNINWETVSRGVNITSIPPGFNPTDRSLYVRVSFAGGVSDDPAYLASLTIVGTTNGSVEHQTRIISTSGTAYRHPDYKPNDLHHHWGTELIGGTLTIGVSGETTPTNPQTVELWARKNSGTATTNLSTYTPYKSGAPTISLDAALITGQWCLVHLTVPSAIGGVISFTGNMEIGQVVLYESVLTASQMQTIEQYYMGSLGMAVGDNSALVVSESPTAANIYAHDWSISTVG